MKIHDYQRVTNWEIWNIFYQYGQVCCFWKQIINFDIVFCYILIKARPTKLNPVFPWLIKSLSKRFPRVILRTTNAQIYKWNDNYLFYLPKVCWVKKNYAYSPMLMSWHDVSVSLNKGLSYDITYK